MILFVNENSGILFLGLGDIIIEIINNEILKFSVRIERIRRFTIER